ncbi:MAG: DnaJ domain-containing protein [Pseudomonadota bacterium]
MSLYLKIILIIFGLAYLVSPMDIIPEIMIPYLGWIDDSLILGTIYYLLRYNKLPDFSFFKKMKNMNNPNQGSPGQNNFQQQAQNTRTSQNQDFYTNSSKGKNPQGTEKKTAKTPYEILNIDPCASKSDIQTAYKEAIKKYHPDKLSHLGEEFAHLANEKFLEIQNAYDVLMKQ